MRREKRPPMHACSINRKRNHQPCNLYHPPPSYFPIPAFSPTTTYLSKAKVLASRRDSSVQPLPQLLISLILRQIQLVEARVRAGKTILVAVVAMNIEAREAIHALKLLEAVKGNFGSARDELQQLGALFLVKGADRSPKPLDLRRRGLVVVVLGVVLPVVHVDVGQTRDEQLEFLLVEDGDKIGGYNVVET